MLPISPHISPHLAISRPISLGEEGAGQGAGHEHDAQHPIPHPYLAHISPTSRPHLAHISQVQAMSTTHSIRAIRRNYWWEKFFWFVSSENYIVVGGRDAQQNEQLVREIYGRCRGDVGEI